MNAVVDAVLFVVVFGLLAHFSQHSGFLGGSTPGFSSSNRSSQSLKKIRFEDAPRLCVRRARIDGDRPRTYKFRILLLPVPLRPRIVVDAARAVEKHDDVPRGKAAAGSLRHILVFAKLSGWSAWIGAAVIAI